MQLPKAMLKAIPKDYHDTSKGTLKLLWEEEWRAIGITQVRGVSPLSGFEALASFSGRETNKQMSRRNQSLTTTTESRLGTLRGPRARAPYSAVQVSHLCVHMDRNRPGLVPQS